MPKRESKRTACIINRKCRAEYVEVLEVVGDSDATTVVNEWGATEYREGQVTRPDSYDDDPRVDCTHGIHFFFTREEAEEWSM